MFRLNWGMPSSIILIMATCVDLILHLRRHGNAFVIDELKILLLNDNQRHPKSKASLEPRLVLTAFIFTSGPVQKGNVLIKRFFLSAFKR